MAIKIVQKGGSGNMSRRDRMDLIEKAMKYGTTSASKNDPNRLVFLQEVSKGRDREFFGDVWLKLSFSDNSRSFTGKCGRVLCSLEYLDHVEKHVFGKNIPNYYCSGNGDRDYGKMIINEVDQFVSSLITDLQKGVIGENYMEKINFDRMFGAKYDLNQIRYTRTKLGKFEKLINPFYTDIVNEIKKLNQEASDLFINDYKAWTNGDALLYAKQKYIDKSQEAINSRKEQYVSALSSTIQTLENTYGIPGCYDCWYSI